MYLKVVKKDNGFTDNDFLSVTCVIGYMFHYFILLVRIELFFILVVPCGKQLFGWIHFQPAFVVVAEELMDHVIFVTHIHQGVF